MIVVDPCPVCGHALHRDDYDEPTGCGGGCDPKLIRDAFDHQQVLHDWPPPASEREPDSLIVDMAEAMGHADDPLPYVIEPFACAAS